MRARATLSDARGLGASRPLISDLGGVERRELIARFLSLPESDLVSKEPHALGPALNASYDAFHDNDDAWFASRDRQIVIVELFQASVRGALARRL